MPKRHPINQAERAPATPRLKIVTSARDEVTGNAARPALVFDVPERTYRKLEQRAAAEGITFDTLMHEVIAKAFREMDAPLPPALVRYLEANDRPIPPKQSSKPEPN
jgi:hypothetical protein